MFFGDCPRNTDAVSHSPHQALKSTRLCCLQTHGSQVAPQSQASDDGEEGSSATLHAGAETLYITVTTTVDVEHEWPETRATCRALDWENGKQQPISQR
ncbi:hypothetical protein D623_10014360 [Myotis brandtii]|uniref:Uncharacterized protein n=1 Tax=Myotis brandtii TaxID=109478 RepID=S7MQV6_MYOBR|nr:hypothetical protein D623_10014360 [Myotis brandtii]